MTSASPETADDLFLRLGSQPFFHTPLVNRAGQTNGKAAPASTVAADDLFLALGTQACFRAVLVASTSGAATVARALAALAITPAVAQGGTAYAGVITGRTTGSAVVATSSDGTALTVNGTNITGTFNSAGAKIITLVETLAGANGNPKATTITIAVAAGTADSSVTADNATLTADQG